MTREPVTYQAYELVDLEGRSVINTPAPGVPVVLASDYDRLAAEVEAYKKQSVCRYCGDHYLNVTICSKCAFKDGKSHTTALLDQLEAMRTELSRAQGALVDAGTVPTETLEGGIRALLDQQRRVREALEEAYHTLENDNSTSHPLLMSIKSILSETGKE